MNLSSILADIVSNIAFFPFFINLPVPFEISWFLVAVPTTLSITSDIPSIIPPFFTAVCACDRFSNFPVTIPNALFPKSIADFIAESIPSFKPTS